MRHSMQLRMALSAIAALSAVGANANGKTENASIPPTHSISASGETGKQLDRSIDALKNLPVRGFFNLPQACSADPADATCRCPHPGGHQDDKE